MMKSFPLIVFIGLIVGCNQVKVQTAAEKAAKMDSLRASLVRADMEWSERSKKNGYYRTRIEYTLDSSIEIEEGVMPVVGRKAFEDYPSTHPDSVFCLGWKPLRVEVDSAGEMGYTFGAFAYYTKTKAGHDTTYYGDYVTIWRRQADGKWKFVMDGGTDTPFPVLSLK